MQIKKIKTYFYGELSSSSQDRARAQFSDGMEYPWFSEATDSLDKFVAHFGGRVTDYSLSQEVHRSYVDTSVSHESFRGVKLKDFDPDHMPTGYCMDTSLWGSFYHEFKKTGHAHQAFNQAIHSFIRDLADDIDGYFSAESIAEQIEINEYEFLEDGKMFNYRCEEETV
jgi:hypothetical protein